MTYFVSGVEFVGGSLLTVGFFSSPACVALLVDMLVAILTTKLSAMPKGLWPSAKESARKGGDFRSRARYFPADEKLHLAKTDQNHMG